MGTQDVAAVRAEPTARNILARNGTVVGPWVSLGGCLALWGIGLGTVHVAQVKNAGLGLVSVLPFIYWVALAGLMASFCWVVTARDSRWPVLVGHLVALVVILHGTPAILYGTLRYAWTWKEIGVVSYVAQNGIHFNLGSELGFYQGWPGFFALNAFLTSAAGLSTALGYASWALVVNDLLWLGPVILIARAFTSDMRLIWTAAWLFELGNWVGQDYFSPQALAFFLYLTVIAVCLRWLWDPRIGPPPEMMEAPKAAAQLPPRRWVIVLCLVPLMVAIASSHQLTPFMLLGALILLVVCRQLRPRSLPLLMAVITAGWILYGGLPWLEANKAYVLNGLGAPWANVSSHIVGQGQVPFGQILVDWTDRSASVVIGILALIGYLRYRRHHDAQGRRSWNRLAVLTVAALPAVAASSYGGEIIFRVYLFALPFLAIAAAAAFFPSLGQGGSRMSAAILAVTTLILLAGFSLGNYGQEAANYFSPQEVAASEWLYQTAPPGTMIVALDTNLPWAFVHYNLYRYTFLDSPPSYSHTVLIAPVQTITRLMGNGPASSYLILTQSQAAAVRLGAVWPADGYERVTDALLASGKFKVVYRNGDAVILQLTRRAANRGGR